MHGLMRSCSDVSVLGVGGHPTLSNCDPTLRKYKNQISEYLVSGNSAFGPDGRILSCEFPLRNMGCHLCGHTTLKRLRSAICSIYFAPRLNILHIFNKQRSWHESTQANAIFLAFTRNQSAEGRLNQEMLGVFFFFFKCISRGTIVHSGNPGPPAPGTLEQSRV